MAVNYIWVMFVPGAAGNFLSRCLQFAEDTVCFADKTHGVPQTLEDKWKLLNYNTVVDSEFQTRDWKQFESCSTPYRNWSMDVSEQNRVWYSHPDRSVLAQGFVEKSDTQTVVYIDPEDQLEWCLMNALYKNSYIIVDWLLQAKEFAQDPSNIVFPLKHLRSTDFIIHFEQLTDQLGLVYTNDGIKYVEKLHTQWLTTVCKDIDNWKKQLGFKIDNS